MIRRLWVGGRRHRRGGSAERLRWEDRIFLLAVAAAIPGTAAALWLLWRAEAPGSLRWLATVLLPAAALAFAWTVRSRVVYSLGTLENLLESLRRRDFSIRGRPTRRDDALQAVVGEINQLADTLREQRLGAIETEALLRKVMAEIDVAVFTFDRQRRLRLVNRAGARLLERSGDRLLGAGAEDLGLAELLDGPNERTLAAEFPRKRGRWGVRWTTFREGGLQHQLLVVTDLSKTLRDQERQAWQRLIRVLGHELNNSLTPIQSMAGTLAGLLRRRPRPADWEEDAERSLALIEERARDLARFMATYSRLAKLPAPRLEPVAVPELVRHVAALETRVEVEIVDGPPVEVPGDRSQLEQLLINLVRNAADAALETGGGVEMRWSEDRGEVRIAVEDEGPGLSTTTNLFVPFFTTKPGGSGIGLVLSLQIAEAHGGGVSLENREEGGCRATLVLPAA